MMNLQDLRTKNYSGAIANSSDNIGKFIRLW